MLLPRCRGSGRGMEWVLGVSRWKLVYTGWINNKDLLYIHYYLINHDGKGYKQ